jgi:hypothetical protein
MRNIRISEEVWNEIATRGKFGENEDDVLRRVFGVKAVGEPPEGPERRPPSIKLASRKFLRGPRKAERVLSPQIVGSKFEVRFPNDGNYRTWDLPPKNDKDGIRKMLGEALAYGEENGATEGQLKAIRKALTDNGYYLIGPRKPRILIVPIK